MNNVLIIGGTGTLGKCLAQKLSDANVTIFSRDEFKQAQMKKEYPQFDYVLGDIRCKDDLKDLNGSFETVFHCAALKHVDIGEREVKQFIKTNLLGTMNVSEYCLDTDSNLIFFSTDKAVLPINAYGMSKALSESYLLSKHEKRLLVYRWGNILGSRGSIVSYFSNLIKQDKPIPITDIRMTRFWLEIDEAVDFVLTTSKEEKSSSKVLIPPVKSAKVIDIADAIAKILDKDFQIDVVGIRPGEKIHECLESYHDYCLRSDTCKNFTKEELIEKLKPLVRKCE